MIHVLNNLPNEYDVILDGLENCLTLSGDDALQVKSSEKNKKNRNKNKKKEK